MSSSVLLLVALVFLTFLLSVDAASPLKRRRHQEVETDTETSIHSPHRPPFPLLDRVGEKVIFSDDFYDFDPSIWSHEITLSGGGNWEFEVTSDTE